MVSRSIRKTFFIVAIFLFEYFDESGLTLLYRGSPGTYFAWVRKYLASFPRTLYGAGPATDWNVIERCGFGNSPATVRSMINPHRKSERARTRHPPYSVWRGTSN
jgi:hypothetical protein